MKEKIVEKLLTVKSIVTFILIGVTAYLAIVSRVEISPEFFASVVTAVITYYFTRKESAGDDK
ncbi:MAG: hypothetical protein IKU30_06025 [Clostridia bacterium]|nr:hypothetical protein [Clostridia bacterium]MBR6447837.1 hypothetical protein [Methanomicrobium sp.]